MMKLGPCPSTSLFDVDIFDPFPGTTGTWDGAAGTFTVQISASIDAACAGTAIFAQISSAVITLNGSGTINVSISGTGSNLFAGEDVATVRLDNVLLAQYESPGGGVADCVGAPLVQVQNDFPVSACACSVLELIWSCGSSWNNNWTCTFTVTVT